MKPIQHLFGHKDKRWALSWVLVVLVLFLWDLHFLNRPSLKLVVSGFINTMIISGLVILFTLVLGWVFTILLDAMQSRRREKTHFVVTFLLNLVRSIPQIVGVLFGYVIVTTLHRQGIISSKMQLFPLLAFAMALFIFPEVVDLMRERIDHYRKLDFFNAMRVCGIRESRIVNFNILWRNSRIHIFNKLISVFGIAVFLQCSVDFIISVGLSTDVNPISLPPTLGSLLAHYDSKQDIQSIASLFSDVSYFPQLFTIHLQGVSVAFLIVFTLVSIYNISNGYAERNQL